MTVDVESLGPKIAELLEQVKPGESVTLVRAGEPVATLAPNKAFRLGEYEALLDRIAEFRKRVDLKDFDIKAAIEEGRR